MKDAEKENQRNLDDEAPHDCVRPHSASFNVTELPDYILFSLGGVRLGVFICTVFEDLHVGVVRVSEQGSFNFLN